ncbi:hypothetical protein Poli38472_006622 [Pythium oligandrum]|uniref:protein-L-isoaspartate(D-aspartate) O-methyltransferase n=1 Tax=Pythium oligandrum TaxID=41045 RepID=A0A8K1FEG6_PYTOL|nr:hypothetical protein Poli38472_006622 [Pythium oligandrum]|eukprot:TMW56612.1 hypothetical protein Poli38472_006622 [Pythium oligandrum]
MHALRRTSLRGLSRPVRCFSVLSGVSEDLLISTSIGHQIGGETHSALVDSLVKTNVVPANSRLECALRAVDRAEFAPQALRSSSAAYENRPLKIGVVATISTPQQHAQVLGMLESHLQPGMRALDIGSGSGYLVAVMAHLVGATGYVQGIDIVPELVEFAQTNLQKTLDDELLESTKITQSMSKNVLDVFSQNDLFDCIHVGVAVETKAEAEAFLPFLKQGGGLLVPLGRGNEEQKLVKMTKHENGDVSKVDVMSVLCQPILDEIPVEVVQETRTEKVTRLEHELKQWRADFETQHGTRPTREDMMADAYAKQLFMDYAAMRK